MPIRVLLAKSEGLASNHQLAMSSCPVFTVGLSSCVEGVPKVFTFGYEHLGHLRFRWFRPFFGQKRRVQILPEPLTCLLHPSRAAF